MDGGAKASSRFAYTAARVFDGERTLVDHAVLIQDGVISAVVPQHSLPEGVPLGREPDGTILPGLTDTHVHFMRWQGPLFLAHGVTTVRDVGNDLEWILARRSECAAELWPRILCVGPLLDGPTPVHAIVSRRCADTADALAAVRETAAAAVDGIKLYVGLRREWLPAMVREGHAAGCKVSMHCSGSGVLVAGRAGVDEFFHLDGVLADVWMSLAEPSRQGLVCGRSHTPWHGISAGPSAGRRRHGVLDRKRGTMGHSACTPSGRECGGWEALTWVEPRLAEGLGGSGSP
jgi:hypothetical protein